jgi:hypothetical protein
MTERRSRRFPSPWSIDEYNDACFIVRHHNGQPECDPRSPSTDEQILRTVMREA